MSGTNMMRVAVIGGEGIGPEVTGQARRVLSWFTERRRLPVAMQDAEFGLDAYRRCGKVIPDETRAAIEGADAILFGATGGPETTEVPVEARKEGSLLKLRRSLDLYANVRPIVTDPALYESAPLKERVLKGVDFVIVRELSSGIYFGEPRGIETRADGSRRGFNTTSYTEAEVRRVARFSFELARAGRAGCVPWTRPTSWKPACCGARWWWRSTRPSSPTWSCRTSTWTTPRCRSCATRRSST